MKKVILKLDLHDDKEKHKAMKMVSTITGIDSIAMDTKEKKMTVVGDMDLIHLVSKLRKVWPTDILSLGLVKEPEKKKDAKEAEKKKDEGKKKEEGKKDDDDKKKDSNDQIAELARLYKPYNPYMTAHYYFHSVEENPNACVIS